MKPSNEEVCLTDERKSTGRERDVPAYDATTFYDALAAHGLIVPVGVLGAFGRGSVFDDVLERFDALILNMAKADGVESMTFPPVIDRAIIERTGYMESFPNLCGVVHSFLGPEREARALTQRIQAGEPWGDMLGMTDLVLNPAACYPLYPTCAGTLPDDGRHVTMLGWVYRQEPSLEPTRMRSFRVRELVRVGEPQTVLAWRDMWLERGVALLKSLQLPARSNVAADPFFGRGGKMLSAGQIEQRLKFEVLVPVISETEPTACCSFNYHQDKFGGAFGIRTAAGQVAHSACLGFGMERVTMALFRTHGFDPNEWPTAVRDRLWP
ncbi:MAG: amino acid--[acyl-carrier-protein] ligase [Gemmatimonadaceae bacterium]